MGAHRIPMPDFLKEEYTEEEYEALPRKVRMRRRNGIKDRSKLHLRKPVPEGYTEEEFLLLSTSQKYNLRHPERASIIYEREKRRREDEKLTNFSLWAEKKWAYHIWREYRITVEQYWAIYDRQGGVCSICKQFETYSIKRVLSKDLPPIEYLQRLCVDHDHETGLIRGLLCFSCNRKLHSQSQDALKWLKDAISYLEISQDNPVYIKEGARKFPTRR